MGQIGISTEDICGRNWQGDELMGCALVHWGRTSMSLLFKVRGWKELE
jgi:hypothetical protein